MRFGTWLAVTYAVPMQPAPTLCANTSVRTSPNMRDTAVMPAMSAAPRAIRAALSGSGSGADAGRAAGSGRGTGAARGGAVRPVSSVCTRNSRTFLAHDRHRRSSAMTSGIASVRLRHWLGPWPSLGRLPAAPVVRPVLHRTQRGYEPLNCVVRGGYRPERHA